MNQPLQLPAPHVGATQEIWDAINVDLQQIVDDVSCWEGARAERVCTQLEAAVKRLNDAVGHEREGYETAIAAGYENDALRERCEELTKERDSLKADAGRWSYFRRHWSNVKIAWNKNGSLKSIVMTIKSASNSNSELCIERYLDAAIKSERSAS